MVSTLSMAGIVGGSYIYQNKSSNDHEKIKTIADNLGLKTADESIRIYRKSKKKHYTEYTYKMPLGLSFKRFKDNQQTFVDGLNNKSEHDFSVQNLKKIDWRGNIPEQLKTLVSNRKTLNKHIEMEYDGMLKFRVYDTGLERHYPLDDEMLQKVSGWEVPVGYALNNFVKHDFEKLQMLVVAGTTRYGKTVFLKNAITTLINNQPNNAKFTLIDLKGGLAFSRFAACKQVKTVAKDADETIRALEDIHSTMISRQQEFLSKGYEDITEAGYTSRDFIVIDEGAEVALFTDKAQRERCVHLIGEIGRLGAGLGWRILFATQYPTADVFPRQVKANTSAALCFKLKNSTQSMVVLDRAGAEELPTELYGRAIYQTDQDRIVQTPLIENGFIDVKLKPHIIVKGVHHESGKGETPDTRRTDHAVFETT